MAEGRGSSRSNEAAAAIANSVLCGDRRPSVAFAAALRINGPKLGREASTNGHSSGRLSHRSSMALPHGASVPPGGQRRGSSLAAVLAGSHVAAAGAGDLADGEPLHPGLDRIKSFNRRKSTFRSGAGGTASQPGVGSVQFDELSAVMDILDSRIGTAVARMRSQNTAGLGVVPGLAHSKRRLRLAGPSGSREAPAPAVLDKAHKQLNCSGPGTAADGNSGQEDCSPQSLPGDETAENLGNHLAHIGIALRNEVRDGLTNAQGGASS